MNSIDNNINGDMNENIIMNMDKNIKKKKKKMNKPVDLDNPIDFDSGINKIIEEQIKNDELSGNKEIEYIPKKSYIFGKNNTMDYLKEIDIEDSDDIKEIKEFKQLNTLKSYPKNYGNIWKDTEREKILKCLENNNYEDTLGIFDEKIINQISKSLGRTEYAIQEEIKKMVYNEYISGKQYEMISKKFNIPIPNIKIILKLYIEKYHIKIINQLEIENKLMKLKLENIKLRKELELINQIN